MWLILDQRALTTKIVCFAMVAGVTDQLWEVADLVALWEEYERRVKEQRRKGRNNDLPELWSGA